MDMCLEDVANSSWGLACSSWNDQEAGGWRAGAPKGSTGHWLTLGGSQVQAAGQSSGASHTAGQGRSRQAQQHRGFQSIGPSWQGWHGSRHTHCRHTSRTGSRARRKPLVSSWNACVTHAHPRR